MLEAYFGEMITVRKEKKQKAEQERERFLDELCVRFEKSRGQEELLQSGFGACEGKRLSVISF